jgi:hypothetical protein
MYNPQHNYCMTCSEEDILVWACETGKLVAEFNTIGGDGSMHLDTIQSKLEKTMEEESRFIMPLPLLHGREQVSHFLRKTFEIPIFLQIQSKMSLIFMISGKTSLSAKLLYIASGVWCTSAICACVICDSCK